MRKFVFLLAVIVTTTYANAQTYRIISRNNDTIRMYPNKLGDAIKSIVPGGSSKSEDNYRLIEKTENEKKTLLFVEFAQLLDKVLITYETDLIHAGEWHIKAYGFSDIYDAIKRENAIFLQGDLLGMHIEIYQRPENFQDVMLIDGVQCPAPIKVQTFETKKVQDEHKKAQAQYGEAWKLKLTEEDISDTNGKMNECYIAYLIKTAKFDIKADRSLLNDLCNIDEIKALQIKFNDAQLEYLSKGYDSRLEKYAL